MSLASQLATSSAPQRHDFRGDFHAEGFEDAIGSFNRDPVILVPFVTGNLRLVHLEPLGQLPLSHSP